MDRWLIFLLPLLLTVKTSPNITDAALTRLSQGTKFFAEGGSEKVFQQTFGCFPGEQLWKVYACYLSTSTGPVIGMLYISTARVAFCSDHPLCYDSHNGQQQWAYYKVHIWFSFFLGTVFLDCSIHALFFSHNIQ